MSSRVFERSAWVVLLLAWIGTIAAYPLLPPVFVTHFSATGSPNGAAPTPVGAFVLPLLMLLLLLLLRAIPQVDPLKINIQYFRKQYDEFVALLILFLACIQASVLAWNLGFVFDEMYVVLPALGVLVFYAGVMLPQTKRNWFIGIRTPWTISSDHVWQKTHELGGTLFKLLGIVIALGVFVPSYALWIIFMPLVIVSVGLILYSYVVYEQDKKAHL